VEDFERENQVRLATDRLEILDAIAAAQERYGEISDVIARAADKRAATTAIAQLIGVREDMGARAISELTWHRLTAESRRQVQQDRDEVRDYLSQLGE
jgi:DNA gyrase/topoisomerase IV subunit A